MNFQSTAQELFAMDPTSPASQLMADVQPASEVHHHHHFQHPSNSEVSAHSIEVGEPIDIEIVVEELPGAPAGTKDPEPMLEVVEEPVKAEEDNNEAKKGKNDKWNWEAHGPHGFVAWIKSRIEDVPKHSGVDSAGLERALAYMDRLDNEISKAMRMDLDGELDANKIEKVRAELDDGMSRLLARLDKVKKTKKSNRKKKSDYEIDEDGFVKEAQKITGVQGIYVTVPLLISRIARVCINGSISAGHDIEDLYSRQIEKYKLNTREQAEVQQLISDMGYPMRQDRGYLPDETLEVTDSNNFDWAANFSG